METDAAFAPSARLKTIKGIRRRLKKTVRALGGLPREEVSPAGGWVLDHARFLLGEMESARWDGRRREKLPARGREPRVMALAREIVAEGEGEVTAPLILRTARTFYENREPAQAELHCLPLALQAALLEGVDGVLRACLREDAAGRRGRAWARGFSRNRRRGLPREDEALRRGLALLSGREEEAALRRARRIMEKTGRKLPDALEEKTARGLRAGRLIASLHGLSRLPFDAIMERLNPAAALLRREETYRRMDNQGRACYQQAVGRLAKKLGASESAVARAALELAREGEGVRGEAGYYLLEETDRIGEALFRRPVRKRSEGGRTVRFLLPLYLGAAAALPAAWAAGTPVWLWPPLLLCVSQLLRTAYFALLRRRFPARRLPRLYFRHLTRETRTLVAVPALLTDPKQAVRLVKHLAVLRCANPDRYLDFLLLADFADGPEETAPGDDDIVSAAAEAVRALRETGGGAYYLHRARQWNGECFAGRERKRGALAMLNHLLTDGERTDPVRFASCDLNALQGRYRYVITLDADTFLPPGAARRLVGAMEHPLQKDRLGVLQPRMEIAPDTVTTRLQRFLGGPGGADVYGFAAQDVYQDALGKGSFVGKGIYRPDLWLARQEGRLEGRPLLSHDLIEGEIVQSALASDLTLYDGHPKTLAGWYRRLHRWTRGDWQLLPFLGDGRLPLLSRHKIWDNLRRSLLPLARVLLLFAAARRGPALLLLALPWPGRGMLRRFLFLPGEAAALTDAAARALHRQFVSHRKLLEWVTAAQGEEGRVPLYCVLAQALSGAALAALSLWPGGFWPGALAGMLWLSAPLWQAALEKPLRIAAPMTAPQRERMRALALDTWRFFEDAVTADTRFLPPDNVQLDPPRGPALRTSPTNAGLYLLSCCAARELGIISSRDMARRLSRTLDALDGLPTWKGHFYNWYDLSTGLPLAPAFVSTVDSGNLAGCLFACAQICRQRLEEIPEDLRCLPGRLDALFSRMDFSALYDPKEKLFFVGFDEETGKPTPARYDLMASEARLTSFLAVMTGQAPPEHWKRLNRATAYCGGGPALLSWGGTLFEYLMPHLLLPLIPGTLMGEGCLCAVRAQMAHRPDRPFGISESGCFSFDADRNYQYRAFGLPALALSGETAGEVIAPYASLLALPFFPFSAARNAQRMESLGWRDGRGFFEAADYTRFSRRPQLVRSHMAHHQGMILCSLCNALCQNALVRAFLSPPAARACAWLLWERAPRRAYRRAALPLPRPRRALPGPCRRAARKGFPLDAHALSAGHMTWVLSAAGQGYLAWKDTLLTRFDPDAGEMTGPQMYLRDGDSGQVLRPLMEGRAAFLSGSAEFSLAWGKWKALVSCCCAPLSGAAVMRLTVENAGKEAGVLEAATYLEAALSSYPDDRAHPNFRDLSVQVRPWGRKGLVARRLSRGEGEAPAPVLCHFAAGVPEPVLLQGDRTLFLGRLGSVRMPEQAGLPGEKCALRTGDTLAPCLSLRCGLTVAPGEKRTAYFVTLCRDSLAELSEDLLKEQTWKEAFSLAYTQDQMAMREMNVDGRALHAYQQILGAVWWRGQPHQGGWPPASRHVLWARGVPGTRPVWMASLRERDDALLRHALRCHAWMRRLGVRTDLILFLPEETQYRRPIRDAAEHALSVCPGGAGEGVTVVAGGEAEREQMEKLCRLTLRSGASLTEQLRRLILSRREESAALTRPRPVLPEKWRDENSFGGFTAEGSYAAVRPAPAPWHNLLCGEAFGTLACETGILHSYAGNSRLNRITRLNPDVHRGVPSEEICLLNEEGTLFSLTSPTALHSPGVTEYRCLCGGALSSLAVFSHPEKAAGFRTLTLRGMEGERYTVFWAVRFSLGEGEEETRCRVRDFRVLAQNGEGPGVAWACLPGARCRVMASGLLSPAALLGGESGGGSAAVLSLPVVLPAGGQIRIGMLLGYSPHEEAAEADCAALLGEDEGERERAVRRWWQNRLGRLTLFAGEKPLEYLLNTWLPYQTLAARLLARMGPYQAGGAWGFRDQLQDLLSLLYTHPAFARRHLLTCAAHQYAEGDAQHWWHPPRRGVRTRISDDRLFLPYMTAQYVKITGDESVLAEKAPYLKSAPLEPDEKDRYEEPESTEWEETLLSHCLRAIDSVGFGEHGLPLMGGGDWNDGMDRVGGERGESVWLGFFLAVVLREFAPLCPGDARERYKALRRRLLDAAESAWTGQWYLRAWYDGGKPLGGPQTDPPRIDLISQVFSVLAGAPRAHAGLALNHALRLLYDREAGLTYLLAPPFSPEEKAGYIGAYLPFVRENGGQYTHAVPWLVLALCKAGKYSFAWEIARTALPTAHADTREKALTYRTEPYVLAGDVCGGENRGRGGWTWYTGAAAWMYHVWLTALLGFEKRGARARLSPAPDSGMEEFTLVYRYGASRWHFTAARDAAFPTLDGEKLTDGWADLVDDGKTHEARFPFR